MNLPTNRAQQDNFGARYYDSTMARFLTPDWSAHLEPVPYAKLNDPQSLNLYSYVENSPALRGDPDGHAGQPVGQSSNNNWLDPDLPYLCSGAAYQVCMLYRSAQDIGSDGWAEVQNAQENVKKQQTEMSVSAQGVAFIESHEGYSASAYEDSAGNPTIGYGHLIKAGERFDKGITKDQATTLLEQDVKSAVGAVNSNLKVKISQIKFDALVDFTYNLGAKTLSNSKLLSNINAGKAVTKSNFTDYNHSGGGVVRGLTIRRRDEFDLFSKGDYGGP